jgi:hypothetical protein
MEPPEPKEIMQASPDEDEDEDEPKSATKIAQKAARAKLGPGEDLVAIHADDNVETLWTSRKIFLMPKIELAKKATRAAALAHLQAAGLLITKT